MKCQSAKTRITNLEFQIILIISKGLSVIVCSKLHFFSKPRFFVVVVVVVVVVVLFLCFLFLFLLFLFFFFFFFVFFIFRENSTVITFLYNNSLGNNIFFGKRDNSSLLGINYQVSVSSMKSFKSSFSELLMYFSIWDSSTYFFKYNIVI